MIKDSILITLEEALKYKKMKLKEIRNSKELLYILNNIIQDNIRDAIDANPTIDYVDIVIKNYDWGGIDVEFIINILKDEYGYKGTKIISDGIKSPILRIPLTK